MNKVILGQIVEINNMETVEKAFEGLIVASRATMNNDTQIGVSLSGIEDASGIIKCYYDIYNKLPFPLSSIEEKIKYACIAMAMQALTDDVLKFKVDDLGIIVKINSKTGIYFSNTSWKLVSIKGIKWDDFVDISLYSKHCSYREYEWALSQIVSGDNLRGYYERFMSGLYTACKGDKRLLREQLGNLLYMKGIPEEVFNIRENTILDAVNGKEYTIDIYMQGKVKTGKSNYVITLGQGVREEAERKIIYDFDIYCKDVIVGHQYGVENDRNIRKMSKVNMNGMMGVFEQLMSSGIENLYNKVYRGAIIRDNIILAVNGVLYTMGKNDYTEPEVFDTHSDLIGVSGNKVYYSRKTVLDSGVKRCTLCSYNSITKDKEIYAISFE